MSDPRGAFTQVSLDVTTIAEALALAEGAVRAGIDWLEAGTPLILGEGMHAVKALRDRFPKHPIVADLKTMDGAGLEAEVMFKAGANMVVVMGQALRWQGDVRRDAVPRQTCQSPARAGVGGGHHHRAHRVRRAQHD